MIDAARALPLLRSAAESWEWRTPDSELPPWVKKAVGRFAEWDNLVDAQIALLTEYLGQAAVVSPERHEAQRYHSARSRDALTAAIEAGHAPDDREQFEQMIKDAAAQDWRAVDRLESDLDKASAAGQPADAAGGADHRGGT